MHPQGAGYRRSSFNDASAEGPRLVTQHRLDNILEFAPLRRSPARFLCTLLRSHHEITHLLEATLNGFHDPAQAPVGFGRIERLFQASRQETTGPEHLADSGNQSGRVTVGAVGIKAGEGGSMDLFELGKSSGGE